MNSRQARKRYEIAYRRFVRVHGMLFPVLQQEALSPFEAQQLSRELRELLIEMNVLGDFVEVDDLRRDEIISEVEAEE